MHFIVELLLVTFLKYDFSYPAFAEINIECDVYALLMVSNNSAV